ncbi:MAG: pyruvate kinase [bacterium]|jgi:pyruvate kinase|nr:pyruvate kinase [bacterium]
MKKTKILCTIGPATQSADAIRLLIQNGMNAARINTSHGDFDQYRQLIHTVRQVADIPIVMDTQGPKVRLRMERTLQLHPGEALRVGFQPAQKFYLDAPIHAQLMPGDPAIIDDGGFDAVIEEKTEDTILFRFLNGGELVSGRAVNFPGKILPLDPLTDKDRCFLAFACEMDIDYIALSFTRGKDDILACRAHLTNPNVKIIAKIENQQGIDNFAEILDQADGIMVARGDMGVELPPATVPMVQKQLIKTCGAKEKLVITATQMLQSMITNPRPTRAEISDVANAILDGSDVVMLSAETSIGQYPSGAVAMMSRIAETTEPHVDINQPSSDPSVEAAICESVRSLCRTAPVTKIVSVTRGGRTAKLISRLRLQQPILALTGERHTCRTLHLYFGVCPVYTESLPDSIPTVTAGMDLYNKGYLREDDLILFVSGEYRPKQFSTNTIQILSMQDILGYANVSG